MNTKRITVRGSSLIEILLYVSFLAVIIVAIGSFVGDVLSAKNKQHAIIEVETEVLSLLETMTYDIKRADLIQVPAASGTGSTLTLEITDGPTTFTRDYFVTNGVFQQKTGNGAQSTVNIQSNRVVVQNLVFRNASWSAGANLVTVSFDISYVNASGRSDFSYSRHVTTSVNRRPN